MDRAQRENGPYAASFSHFRSETSGSVQTSPVPGVVVQAHYGDARLNRLFVVPRFEITLSDRSILRTSEQTDLIVRDAAEMRSMNLNPGTVWMPAVKGSNASIATPVATAAVHGTEFEVTAEGDLIVFEGEVELSGSGETPLLRQAARGRRRTRAGMLFG